MGGIVRVQVRLSAETYLRLQVVAAQLGTTRDKLAAAAVERFLDSHAADGAGIDHSDAEPIVSARLSSSGGLAIVFADAKCVRITAGEVPEWFGDVIGVELAADGLGLWLVASAGAATRFYLDFFRSLLDLDLRARGDRESVQRKHAAAGQLRLARQRRGLSVAQLGKASGIPKSRVHAVERGVVEVARPELVALAGALEVQVETLDVE
jgi:hypothetical protein